jgi:hypothetical protein
MKTTLQKLFIVLASMPVGMCLAQPTLTDANCNPVAGETYSVVIGNFVSVGNAGAHQTWNLTAFSPTVSGPANTVIAANTPSASLYPNSSINYSDVLMSQYYKTSTNVLQNYGKYHHAGSNPGKLVTIYSDPIDMLHLPLNFNDTYTDSYLGTKYSTTNTSPTYIRFGTYTITADGYGSLTVPTGSYASVMRVHMHSSNRDSIANNSSGGYYIMDEYLWYQPGTHYPVAGYFNYDGVMHSFYISGNLTGLNDRKNESLAFELFPNPASELLNIRFPVSPTGKMQLGIYNSLGQELKTIDANATLTVDQAINISEFSNGIYILQLKENGTLLNSKRFVISR